VLLAAVTDQDRGVQDPAGATDRSGPVFPLVVLFIVMRKQVMHSLGSVVMR
jgi:hypothetical protein